jgi:hypothetical protein
MLIHRITSRNIAWYPEECYTYFLFRVPEDVIKLCVVAAPSLTSWLGTKVRKGIKGEAGNIFIRTLSGKTIIQIAGFKTCDFCLHFQSPLPRSQWTLFVKNASVSIFASRNLRPHVYVCRPVFVPCCVRTIPSGCDAPFYYDQPSTLLWCDTKL